MGCESKSWAPSRWSRFKRHAFEEHVYIHMEIALDHWWGVFVGAKMIAAIRAERNTRISKLRLEEQGFATMGSA